MGEKKVSAAIRGKADPLLFQRAVEWANVPSTLKRGRRKDEEDTKKRTGNERDASRRIPSIDIYPDRRRRADKPNGGLLPQTRRKTDHEPRGPGGTWRKWRTAGAVEGTPVSDKVAVPYRGCGLGSLPAASRPLVASRAPVILLILTCSARHGSPHHLELRLNPPRAPEL